MTTLPPRFPCWCRAVYSWGGETDKDLGFVEGDLIECLNAGDGSWWMGRLRRDRRMMGLFPSNFVVVLQEDFVPVSRSVSPMPTRSDSSRKNSIESLERKKEQAKKRRPFQGYKSAAPTNLTANSSPSPLKYQSQPTVSKESYTGPPSTVLWQQKSPSRIYARSPSPLPPEELGSPPPPPPPPHRSGIQNGHISRGPSPAPHPLDMNDRYHAISRTPSPNVASLQGHTPPMIRDAMDGVMSSLEGMSMHHKIDQHDQGEDQPLNPWSPEAFDNFASPHTRAGLRPLTSLGLGPGGSSYSEEARERYSSRHNSPDRYVDGPPHLETYVQRMERQLEERAKQREGSVDTGGIPPPPPPKNTGWNTGAIGRRLSLRRRKSAYDLGGLDRSPTTKTNSTNSSSGLQSLASIPSNASSRTGQSVFSGFSAGAFSATSAGSLARKKFGHGGFEDSAPVQVRPTTSSGVRNDRTAWNDRPKTPNTGYSYHSSHDSRAGARSAVGFDERPTPSSTGGLGGFMTPKAKKTGFLKKLNESVKTSFASARSTIAPSDGGSRSASPTKSFNNGVTSIAGGMASPDRRDRHKSATSNGYYGSDAAREMGLSSGTGADWMRTRRDVNRSNTPGPQERRDRADRCQMLNEPVICPVDELYETVHGDEDCNGQPVYQPFVLSNPSFTQVDKGARFITSLPSTITAASLARDFLCRPYRSDVQRLRAIFIWCAERLAWSEDVGMSFGGQGGRIDTRRIIQQKSGSSQEVAALVMEMCRAIGLSAKLIQGYLKKPGEQFDLDAVSNGKANHYWNSVLVDGEWRLIDSSLASPTNPQRALYSNISTSIAESWYFLTKPSELCWTHVPVDHIQQHMVPPVSPDTLLALPGTCPTFFRLGLMMHAYDTSLVRLEGLEMTTIAVNVPVDVEIYAEVEAQAYREDHDGDLYEDPFTATKVRVLSQPNWYLTSTNPDILQKRFIIKAILPGDERFGTLKVYAGKKGLMHSAKEIIHPLAFALPLYHTGENPAYEFVRRHPTPHAMRQDIYVLQPQCWRLGYGENYVFCVRQHSAHVSGTTPTTEQNGFDFNPRPSSPNPLFRPSSALSMTSSAAGSSQQGSDSSSSNAANGVKVKDKPAKLAIQSPSGRIIRMTRKTDNWPQPAAAKEVDGEVVGSVWEASVKVAERGTWRGLVLADRSARWCVWGEWDCC